MDDTKPLEPPVQALPPQGVTPPPIVVKMTKPRPALPPGASTEILSPEESRQKALDLERQIQSGGGMMELSPADRRKLGRNACRVYLALLGLMDRDVAAAKEKDKGWMADAEEVLADILIEDFGVKDLKEARWILGGAILVPPAIDAYTEMKKKKGTKNEGRQESPAPRKNQAPDPGAHQGVQGKGS